MSCRRLVQIGHVGAGDQDSSEEVRVNLTVLNKNVFALVMVFTCYSGQLHHVSRLGGDGVPWSAEQCGRQVNAGPTVCGCSASVGSE